jgi:hypothetical protein
MPNQTCSWPHWSTRAPLNPGIRLSPSGCLEYVCSRSRHSLIPPPPPPPAYSQHRLLPTIQQIVRYWSTKIFVLFNMFGGKWLTDWAQFLCPVCPLAAWKIPYCGNSADLAQLACYDRKKIGAVRRWQTGASYCTHLPFHAIVEVTSWLFFNDSTLTAVYPYICNALG